MKIAQVGRFAETISVARADLRLERHLEADCGAAAPETQGTAQLPVNKRLSR